MDISGELIQELNRTRDWELAEKLTQAEVELILAEKLNHLIRDDFGQLVQLLYRIDIEEPGLKKLLEQHKGEDAGKIIAGMIIQRMQQKIITRNQFREKDNDIPEENRW